MRRSLFIFAVLISLLPLSGFATKKDSLLNVLKNPKEDTNTIKAYNTLAWILLNEDKLDSAESYTRKGLALAEKLDVKRIMGSAYVKLGIIQYHRSNYAKATEYFHKSLEYSLPLKDNLGIIASYNNLGIIYHSQGNFPKALEYSLKSLKIREEQKDKHGIATSYNNIALIYKEQGDLKHGLDYNFKALKLKEELKDTMSMAQSYNNIGIIYDLQKDYVKALEYYSKAMAIYKGLENTEDLGMCLNNIGMVYVHQRKMDMALENFQRALQINKSNNDQAFIADVFVNISGIYIERKEFKKAIAYADSSLRIAKEFSLFDNLRTSYENLSLAYSKMGDYENAFKNHVLFKQIQDSVFNQESTQMLSDLKTGFEVEKKETELNAKAAAEKEKLQEIAAIDQQKRNYVIIGVVLILLIVSVFSISLYKRFKLTNAQKNIIEIQRNEVQDQKSIIEEKQKEILDSIHYAKRIQTTLLAHKDFIDENISQNFVMFNPKDIVSGDFYWATKKGNYFFLAVCDSTGHGVPGAFMSLLNINFLNEAINEKNILEPEAVFNFVRDKLVDALSKDGQKDGFDGILLRVNQITGDMCYAAANNSPVMIVNNEIQLLDYDRMPVGKGEKAAYFTNHKISKSEGATLYLYTDGYADQFGGAKGKKLKYKPLNELLLSLVDEPLEKQKIALDKHFQSWKGHLEQVDDVCVIGIKL